MTIKFNKLTISIFILILSAILCLLGHNLIISIIASLIILGCPIYYYQKTKE